MWQPMATGSPNLGQKKVQGVTEEGLSLGMTWQIADIKKPLASIGRICDAGNVAFFTKNGGYVVQQGLLGETIEKIERQGRNALRMKRDNGVYSFNLWVPRLNTPRETISTSNRFAPLQEDYAGAAQGFHRLGHCLH